MTTVSPIVYASPIRVSASPALRRGLALVVLAVTVALGGASLGSAAHAETTPAPPARQLVVQRGDTLSQIAVEQLPHLPMGEAVFRIQQANRMSTAQVSAGQSLVIPR